MYACVATRSKNLKYKFFILNPEDIQNSKKSTYSPQKNNMKNYLFTKKNIN